MTVVYSSTETKHDPKEEFEGNGFLLRAHPESRGRASAILEALRRMPDVRVETPDEISIQDLCTVHEHGYIEFLTAISETDRTVAPDTFAVRGTGRPPKNPIAAIGYYGTDPATPIESGTWEPAFAAAAVALTGAAKILAGERSAYALCRPPGHHAGRDYFGGFCYLNNAALASDELRSLGRVAILDVDYHHGNGTQDIFYRSSDVYFASIHADPEVAYPHFYGFRDELGAGPGRGFNRNYPLAKGCSASEYRRTVEEALARLEAFAPASLVVSVGYDAFEGDPVGGLCLSFDDYEWIGRAIADLRVPALLVQEGGYAVDELGRCAQALVYGLNRS